MSTNLKTRLLAFWGTVVFTFIPLIDSLSQKGTNYEEPTETISEVEPTKRGPERTSGVEPTKRGPERTIEIYSQAEEPLATFQIYQDYKTGILYTLAGNNIDDITEYYDGIKAKYREEFGDNIIIRTSYMPQTDEKTIFDDGTSVLTFETDLGTITAKTTYFSNPESATSLWLGTDGKFVSACNSYPMVTVEERRLPDGTTKIDVIIGEQIVETGIIPASQIEPNIKRLLPIDKKTII